MFASPLTLLSLVIAIMALAFARKASDQAARLRARLDAIETTTSAGAKSAKPPLPQQLESAAAPPPDSAAPPQPAHTVPPPQATAPPPLPPAEPGFEERIGTRWVVWIGGLTLALGGFFLV